MKRLIAIFMLLSLPAYANEVITGFDKDRDLPVLNEELRKLNKRVDAVTGGAAPSSIVSSGFTMSTDRLLGRDTAGTGAIEELTIGSGLTLSGGELNTSGSAGDITSVGDVVSGAAFDGTQGTTLTFNNAGGDATVAYDGTNIAFSKTIVPSSNDGAALGTTALKWSDINLASGGTINWNNGDIVMTQTTINELTWTGGNILFSGSASGWSINDDLFTTYGTGADVQMLWDTTGNDHMLVQVKADGDATRSGYLVIGDTAAYTLTSTSTDPILRVLAGDDTDYVDLYHDRTNARVEVSSGAFNVSTSIVTTGTLSSTSTGSLGWSIVAGANTACTTTCTSAAVMGWDTAVTEVAVGPADATADKCLCAGPS